jgi:hypothetical protein
MAAGGAVLGGQRRRPLPTTEGAVILGCRNVWVTTGKPSIEFGRAAPL